MRPKARRGATAKGGGYPLGEVHKRIDAASSALRDYLINRHDLPAPLVEEMIMHGRERALTGAIGSGFPHQDVERLAADLVAERRLTPTLLLRSLCLGQLQFFEAAMAALASLGLILACTGGGAGAGSGALQAGISNNVASRPPVGIVWWWRSGTVVSRRNASRKASMSSP